jgi:hypothetical protein
MPWCGFWGAGYWWVLPLIAVIFMGIMFLFCSRGFGCMGTRRRAPAQSGDRALAEGGPPACCAARAENEPRRA